MRWLDPVIPPQIDHAARVAAAEALAAAHPLDMAAPRALGDACFAARDFARAHIVYTDAAARDPDGFDHWARLAEACLWAREPREALRAIEQGLRRAPDGELHLLRGRALRQLGLDGAAIADFERALALGPNFHAPLKALLRPLAKRGDPAALLGFCEALDPQHRHNALVLGYRAAALSQLGRVEEACALVDLDRYVAWAPLPPPPGYADIPAFNRALADEILGHPLAESSDPDVSVDYAAPVGPALGALRTAVRAQMEAYLDRFDEMSLDRALPAPPPAATMRMGITVLRADGSNRQHLHPTGYLSSVYYVRVPESVRAANDGRGSLQIGPCDQRTRGHRACWGERLIKPVEGWLVIFPSHLFHDVIPTRTLEARISVPLDLEPVWHMA